MRGGRGEIWYHHHMNKITGDSEVSVILRKDLLYGERDYTFTKINEVRKLTKKLKTRM